MSTRLLRSSSLRLHLPWEVLLGVCQQSDESTLKSLCLVSFGMLELAGPLLFEDIEIQTLQRLYSFFITPSLMIPATSRLRPLLGLSRLRILRLRIPASQDDLYDEIFPTSTWSLPHHRLNTRLRIRVLSRTIPAYPSRRIEDLLEDRLLSRIRRTHTLSLRWFPQDAAETSFQVVSYEVAIAQNGTSLLERIIDLPLQRACKAISTIQATTQGASSSGGIAKVTTRLDLRSVVVGGLEDWREEVEDATSRTMVEHEVFWKAAPDLEMEVLVGEEVVAKVVEEVMKELSVERRSRCRVVRF